MLELLQVMHEPARLRIVAVELKPELSRLREHVSAPGQLRHQHTLLVPDETWIDVLVRVAVLQDGRHVLASLVRECAQAHKRLLRRQREVGDLGHGAGELREPAHAACGHCLDALLEDQVRHDRDQVGVAAPLSVAVDGALHHFSARGDAFERVGHRQLAVVVRVDAHAGGGAGLPQALRHRLHTSMDMHRKAAAVGVAQHDPGSAGRGRRSAHLQRI